MSIQKNAIQGENNKFKLWLVSSVALLSLGAINALAQDTSTTTNVNTSASSRSSSVGLR